MQRKPFADGSISISAGSKQFPTALRLKLAKSLRCWPVFSASGGSTLAELSTLLTKARPQSDLVSLTARCPVTLRVVKNDL